MKKIQIALVHCPNTFSYKLVNYSEELGIDESCIMWMFDSSKLNTAEKIMRNLNIAHVLNETNHDFSLVA